MTPFTHSCPRSAHQPPARMRLVPSDLKVLLHRGKTSSPFPKAWEGGNMWASQLRRRSVAISKGHAGLTSTDGEEPAQLTGSGPRLFFFCLGDQAKSQGEIQPQRLCEPAPAPWLTAPFQLRSAWMLACLQAWRLDLRNYFNTSVHANNMRGVICIILLPACQQTHQLPGIFAFFAS